MDYTKILLSAEQSLSYDYPDVVDAIKLKIGSGATGGEIGSLVGGYLKQLRDESHPAYLILKSDFDLYLSQFIWI